MVLQKNFLIKMMQVWYHANCNGKSKGCTNTKLVEKGGCAIWYDEPKVGRLDTEYFFNLSFFTVLAFNRG